MSLQQRGTGFLSAREKYRPRIAAQKPTISNSFIFNYLKNVEKGQAALPPFRHWQGNCRSLSGV
jgi:hypothetical protein